VTYVDDDHIKLSNLVTRHGIELGLDSVKNFHEPNFLILLCQVFIDVPGVGWRIEPLLQHHVTKPTADEVLVQALRDNALFFPGMTRASMEQLLQPGPARDAWFAARQRDEHQGVRLPVPTGASNVFFHIPLLQLQQAQEKLLAARRAAVSDPLED
jgi:hypothetical protein